MELTIDQALQQGIAAHKEGKLQDAERLYRAIYFVWGWVTLTYVK